MRSFVRLDDVLLRIRDTRIHHVFGARHLLREYSVKEETFANLIQVSLRTPRGLLWPLLLFCFACAAPFASPQPGQHVGEVQRADPG